MSTITNKSAARRSMLVACGIVCSAVLSYMAPGAQAQSSYTWTSSTSGNWSNGAKWQGGSAPAVDTVGNVNLEFNAAGTYTSNNDLGPFYVYNTTFDAGNGATNITGGDMNLSWPLSEANNPTFTNNSANPVTINNNVNFEAPNGVGGTVEYFSMAAGSTTTFNGSIGITGGSGMKMVNGESSGSGGPGGTMIWTQPVVFTNSPTTQYGNYFPFRIYEGTLEMGGYTIFNGGSDAPILSIDGVNIIQSNVGVNNSAITDMYIGPEDYENGHPNDVAAFYLIADGDTFNQPVQIGDAGTITIGGVNTSGTVTFNDFFKTLPTDGNGIVNGVSQIIYYSAAAGGTVLQNFQLVRGGGGGSCGAGIDKIGAGTWIVNAGGTSDAGTQAYTGNTTVRDGTLELEYDDTGTNYVTLPSAALANPNATYYASGLDGGSLGYNAATNPVQLGDSGTLPTDNIALLTLTGFSSPRLVVHYINVNNNNPNGTTTIGVADNGTANFQGNILLNKTVVLTSGAKGVANFSGNISGVGGITIAGTGVVNLSGTNSYQGITNVTSGTLSLANVSGTEASTLFHDLQTGYHAGAWNGTSPTNAVIISSTATAARGITTLGYKYDSTADTFAITYTLVGDTDLNGLVNNADLTAMAPVGTTNANWSIGDFNYDTIVNSDDYALLMLGAIYGHVPGAPVPEPGAIALLALPMAGLFVRKRRKI